KRTGHGDAEAAKTLVEQYLAAVGNPSETITEDLLGLFYWLTGAPREAVDHFQVAYEKEGSVLAGCGLVMMTDELDDPARRDEFLDGLCTNLREKAPRTIEAMSLLRDALSKGDAGTLDLSAVEDVLSRTRPEGHGPIEFLVGWFLRKHGKAEDA